MSITITVDTVQQAVQQLGLSDQLDYLTLYRALEHQALGTVIQTTLAPPPLDPQQRTMLVSAARSTTPGEPVPPHSSKAAPATLDANEVAKRRNLVQRAKNDFKGAIPMAFVILSPLKSYRNIHFVFENPSCPWDSGAQSCMVTIESLNNEVNAGTQGPDFLHMDVMIWGATARINIPLAIKPAAQMPHQSMSFILGQKFFLEQLEYNVTPDAVERIQHQATYGTVTYI